MLIRNTLSQARCKCGCHCVQATSDLSPLVGWPLLPLALPAATSPTGTSAAQPAATSVPSAVLPPTPPSPPGASTAALSTATDAGTPILQPTTALSAPASEPSAAPASAPASAQAGSSSTAPATTTAAAATVRQLAALQPVEKSLVVQVTSEEGVGGTHAGVLQSALEHLGLMCAHNARPRCYRHAS